MYCFSHSFFSPSTYENVVLLANFFTYVQTLCLFTYFARKFTTTFLARLLAYDVRYTRRSFECRKTCIILSQLLTIPIAHRLRILPSILGPRRQGRQRRLYSQAKRFSESIISRKHQYGVVFFAATRRSKQDGA